MCELVVARGAVRPLPGLRPHSITGFCKVSDVADRSLLQARREGWSKQLRSFCASRWTEADKGKRAELRSFAGRQLWRTAACQGRARKSSFFGASAGKVGLCANACFRCRHAWTNRPQKRVFPALHLDTFGVTCARRRFPL